MGVTCGLTRMPDNPEIWKAAAMADQFDKMQKLPDPLPGCPNFHRIPGYKVYTCGQPTLDGIKNVLEKVTGTIYPKDGRIIWLNLRQEPNVYVNGNPICARPPNKIGEYAELGAVTREMVETDIPPAALSNLEGLANSDFKGNLGKIIHDIYQTAHVMFSDMPQGDHKKRAKYRFASKTLMRILPSPVKSEIEGLIEKKTISLDLYEILGKCTWKPV